MHPDNQWIPKDKQNLGINCFVQYSKVELTITKMRILLMSLKGKPRTASLQLLRVRWGHKYNEDPWLQKNNSAIQSTCKHLYAE